MPILNEKDFENAKRDIDDIGKSANERKIVVPRYGAPYKSLPLISDQFQDAINTIINKDGIPAAAISVYGGGNQQNTNDFVRLDIDRIDSQKADLSVVNAGLQNKADLSYVDAVVSTKAEKQYIDDAVANNEQFVNEALSSLSTQATKFYTTLAAANADIANLEVNQPVQIGEAVNGGLYYKASEEATSLTKSAYDVREEVREMLAQLAEDFASNDLATVKPKTLTGENLYDLTENGEYIQPVAANASLSLNYPVATSGKLTRYHNNLTGSNKRVVLEYRTFTTNKLYLNSYNANAWTGWIDVLSAKNVSGVVQIGVLTPTVITALGYVSADDIVTSGTYYVTSSSSAASLGLPNARGGWLTVAFEGTDSGSKTGFRMYSPLGKNGLYTSKKAAGASSSWSDWTYIPTESEIISLIDQYSDSDGVDKSIDNAVIGIGSSSMDRWGTQLRVECNSRGRDYVNAGFPGTTAATAAMYCGHANYYLNFANNTVLQNGVATTFTFSNDGFGTSNSNPNLDDRGWKVTLENGVRGQLNGYARTFVPENLTESLTVSGAVKVNSDYARYKRAINIVNTGKNNMSDTAYDVIINSFDETIRQIYLAQGNDDRFIVVGHFANRTYTPASVTVIDNVNAYLKNKYGNRYVDSKAWLCSSKVWTDLGITPTQADLDLQSTGNIPTSLASDGVHMNTKVGNYFVTNFIVPKLISLKYIPQ